MRPQPRSRAFPCILALPRRSTAPQQSTGRSLPWPARSVCASCAQPAAPAAFASGMIEWDFTRIGVDAVTSEHGDPLHPAVLTLEELILQFGPGKRNGRRVVFTNGCFDLLHPGHIKLLEAAREMGDALVVGINTDER